jgi:hypothetical protein
MRRLSVIRDLRPSNKRMSGIRRTFMAMGASVLTVIIIFTLLAVYPIPVLSPTFVAVGFPLAYPILEIVPDSFIHALAPGGGPDAVAWAVAVGTFITWSAIFFVLWFVVFGRMRSIRE